MAVTELAILAPVHGVPIRVGGLAHGLGGALRGVVHLVEPLVLGALAVGGLVAGRFVWRLRRPFRP